MVELLYFNNQIKFIIIHNMQLILMGNYIYVNNLFKDYLKEDMHKIH